MTMTNEEIVREYRQAAHPAQQIGILADLNECKKKAIVEILREAGCRLPGYYDKKPAKVPAEPQPVAATDTDVGRTEDAQPDALPFLIRAAAIDAIATLLARGDRDDPDGFREQVRGVLALVHEVERRCDDGKEG